MRISQGVGPPGQAGGFADATRRLAASRRMRRAVGSARQAVIRSRLPIAAALAYAVIAGFVATRAIVKGAVIGELVAIVVAVLPLLVAITWRRPLAFPFTLYLIFIPLENLLTVGGLGTITRLLGLASIVPIVIAIVRNRDRIPLPRSATALGLLVCWMLLSFMWASNLEGGVALFQTFGSLALVYVVVSMYPADGRDLRVALAATAASGICASAYGIWLLQRGGMISDDGRFAIQIGESYIDPNHFANSLLVPTAILLMATFRARSLLAKAAFAFLTLIVVYGIYVTLSREALLALSAMLVYFLFRSRYRAQVGAILACGGVLLTLQGTLVERFSIMFSTGGAGRLAIWRVGYDAFRQHWFGGVGLGSFTDAYNDSYLNVYQAYGAGWGRASHNVIIHFAVELGIVGLLLLFVFIRGQFNLAAKVTRTDEAYDIRIALEGGLISICVASMFIDLFVYKYAWVPLFLLVILRAIHARGKTLSVPQRRHNQPVMNYFAREAQT